MKTLFYASCCALLLSAPAMGQKDACRFETDTSQPLQTIDGFGASDAWSMQYVGIWADSVRRQAADWLFSRKNDSNGRPLGIGLSIWRFNIGTGSAEQGEESGIGSPWMRTERLLTPDGAFDPTRQRGQRNILQMAKERGVETFIGFFNSPPVDYTQNGMATNTGRDGTLNLKADCYDKFAQYAAGVVKGLEHHDGIRLDYVCPVNEPDGHWNWIGPKQEGTPATNREVARLATGIRHTSPVQSGQCGHLYRQSAQRPSSDGRTQLLDQHAAAVPARYPHAAQGHPGPVWRTVLADRDLHHEQR